MVTIATLGSHSALDVCEGAKAEGFRTLVVAQEGREKTYSQYYKTRKAGKREIGVVDEVLLLERFKYLVTPENVKFLKRRDAIFVPNRSLSVYVGSDAIEKRFPIPLFGNRRLLRAEERGEKRNQYYLLEKAGIRMPKKLESPQHIHTPCIVKVPEARRPYERAFFIASSYDEYRQKSEDMIGRGAITRQALETAVIEEFIVGAQFNFNFFYSPLREELELLGIDTRRQTNLDGLLRMTADAQVEALRHVRPTTIEVGHVAATLRESLLEKVFEAGEKLLEACRDAYEPGIIGPFALQCAIEETETGEEPVVFDVSFRMPGSPGTRFTPYPSYLFRESVSFGRRIAMEIKDAVRMKKTGKVTT